MNTKLKVLNEFPTNAELNALFKRVGFPRANKYEYDLYKSESCYSIQIRDNIDLVGMAYVTRPQYQGENYTIYAVAVDPDYQNQGIGSYMIKNILEWYNKLPSEKAYLSLYCDFSLSNFYTKFGFINESLHQMVYHEWAQELDL